MRASAEVEIAPNDIRFTALLLSLALAASAEGQTSATVRKDKHGDPLPAGAMVRLGTNRMNSTGILSPDGKVLTCNSVTEIRLFSVETGKPVGGWQHDKADNLSLVYSPDGQILAIGSGPTIQLRKAQSGAVIRQWEGHKDFLSVLAFSANGKTLATCGIDKSIRLWDASTGKLLHHLNSGHRMHGASAAFSPDGKTLASVGHDATIRLWNVAAGKEIATLQPRNVNTAVVFSPDSEILIHAGWNDGFIRYWHIGQAQEVKQIPTDRMVTGLAMSADGAFLVSTGGDGIIHVWDRESGVELGQVRATTGETISHLSMDRKGETLTTANAGGQRSYLWRITRQGKNYLLAKLHVFEGHDSPIASLAFSPNGKLILSTAGNDRTICLWDHDTGKLLRQFFCGQFPATAALSSDGLHLGMVSAIAECSILELPQGKLVRKFETAPRTHPRSLALTPDGRSLIFCGSDSTIYVTETATGKTRAAFKVNCDLWRIVLSADGYTLAGTGYQESGTGLWDLITGKELARWNLPQINNFAFAADGALVTSSYKDHALRRWDLTGKEIGDPKKAWRGVLHFAYFPDGQTIATNSGKQDTVLRDLATGKVVHQLPGEYAPLAVAPDGRTLATGDGNAILLWAVDPWAKADPVKPSRLSTKEIEARLAKLEKRPWEDLWSDLADPDSSKAYPALWGLVAQAKETENRLAKLLPKLAQRDDDMLPRLRAIEVLEHLASPAARKILQALTTDAPEGVRQAAQAALMRLKQR